MRPENVNIKFDLKGVNNYVVEKIYSARITTLARPASQEELRSSHL